MALADYLKATDVAFAQQCEGEATAMVARLIGTATVPDGVKALAIRETGADIYHRRSARNGLASFGVEGDIQPVRISRDPLASARAILGDYLGPGIA